ncbi:MAG: sigma-70 family RNA polymerase sigma factor [Clostridia bacterium]|nr:sigma-70 family RNA polymerase sigma factor [Clostridia bacterium]
MNETQLSPLLAQYALSPTPELMAQLVEGCLPLCRHIARRFSGQGVETEDLEQVAAMALMKAIQRFEPERGLKFTTYATPTIAGEVRNYIRDKGPAIRMSRDSRSQLFRMQKLQDRLTQELQREPTIRELAQAMDVTHEELLKLLDQRDSTQVASMSSGTSADEDAQLLEEKLGGLDQGYEQVEQREWMQWVFSQVTPVEKRLLELRYIHRMGQRETARHLGVSQMQVSRMERRILARLRETSGQLN